MAIRHFLIRLTAALVFGMLTVVSAGAGTIDVLWYTFESGSTFYRDGITTLAGSAGTYDPDGDGSNMWNLTFFGPGDTPTFSDYDVLVTQSFDFSSPDYSGILDNKAGIEGARGSRTFITGQDADFHYLLGPGAVDDGPRGFLINAVNWAASGTDLGIVALNEGWAGTGSLWWLDDDSFLKSELDGFVTYLQEESVIIPAASAGFPVNEGLSSTGLSNWGTSSHAVIDKDILDYLSINDAGQNPGFAVTLVTESEAGGGTTPSAPEPGTIALLGLGLLGLGHARRRQRH